MGMQGCGAGKASLAAPVAFPFPGRNDYPNHRGLRLYIMAVAFLVSVSHLPTDKTGLTSGV